MKFNYFKMIEDKYKTRLSFKKPIIIRLDGKNITKNKEIDMLNEDLNEFAYALKETASYMSRKFNCITLASSDEINIIINNPNLLYRIYGSMECQKISSLIAQDVGFLFNSNYQGARVLFDARTFNIPNDKIKSYIVYRTQSARNLYTVYFAKKFLTPSERRKKKISEIEYILSSFSHDFKNRSEHQRIGSSFYNGVPVEVSLLLDNSDLYSSLEKIIHEKTKAIILDDEDTDELFDDLSK